MIPDQESDDSSLDELDGTPARKPLLHEYITKLVETSSMHGIKHAYHITDPFRKLFWVIIIIAALYYAIQKVYQSTTHYLKHPILTARSKRYVDELAFPAVSFCNLNDLRFSVTNGTSLHNAIVEQDPSLVNAEDYDRITKEGRHLLSEMIVGCKFNGVKCSGDNFTRFDWSQGDQCFTFNSGKDGHPLLRVSGSGKKRALVLTLNVQHYDYYDLTKSGVHLIIHGQEETPVRMQGPIIPPGFSTYIQVSKKKVGLMMII